MDDYSDDAGGMFPAVATAQRLGQKSILNGYSDSFKNMYGFHPETPFKAVGNAALDVGRYLGGRADAATAPGGYKPPVDTTRTGALVDQATAFAKGLVSPEAQKAVAEQSAMKAIAGTVNAVTDSAPASASASAALQSGLDSHGQSAPATSFDLGKGLLAGAGIGLGATGLYYLAKYLSAKRKKPRPTTAASVMPKMAWDAQSLLDTITSLPGNVGSALLHGAPNGAGNLLTPSSDGWIQGGVNRGLGLLAPAAGIAGGGMLAASIAKRMRHRAAEADTETARQEYLDALTGAKAAGLDAAYEKYAAGTLTDQIGNLLKAVSQNAATVGTVAAGVGVPIGATYMYNKTRNNSLSANALKAQALKARTRSLPGTWIDPEELAKIKQMAMANSAAAT